MKPWVLYSVVRVLVVAVAFTALMLIGIVWWLSAILAAVIGLCISYIFFGKLRDAVALDIAERRARRPEDHVDAVAEDEVLDEASDR